MQQRSSLLGPIFNANESEDNEEGAAEGEEPKVSILQDWPLDGYPANISSALAQGEMETEEADEVLSGGKEALMLTLHDYLRSRGNTSSSVELVSHFKTRITPDDAVLFRSMLKQIATFNKTTKTWTLRNEFAE